VRVTFLSDLQGFSVSDFGASMTTTTVRGILRGIGGGGGRVSWGGRGRRGHPWYPQTHKVKEKERLVKEKKKGGKGSIGGGGERNKMMAVGFGRERAQLE
jgi:hypothetical protein